MQPINLKIHSCGTVTSVLFFLFKIDQYLEDDAKNVICSFLRMVVFIKQCSLENRMANDILQIAEFEFAAWKFLSAVY